MLRTTTTTTRASRIRRPILAALALVAVMAGALPLTSAPASAAPAEVTVVPYASTVGHRLPVVYDEPVLGGFATVGNSWLSCSSTQYCDRRPSHGLLSNGGNHNNAGNPAVADDYVNQFFVGADAIARHGNTSVPLSSGARVEIPAGAHIAHARLSWGGVNQSGRYNPEPSTTGHLDSLYRMPALSIGAAAGPFEEVGGDVRVIVSGPAYGVSGAQFYSAIADVTDLFDGATGDVDVYTVPGPIHDRYGAGVANGNVSAGWALTVVFAFDTPAAAHAAGYNLQQVRIVEGMLIAGSGSGWTESVPFAFPPLPSTSGVHVGLIGYEGDINKTGDRFELTTDTTVDVAPPWDSTQSGNFWAGVAKNSLPHTPIAEYSGALPAPGDTWSPGNTYEAGTSAGTPVPFSNNFSVDAYDWMPTDFPWAVGTTGLDIRLNAPSGEGYFLQQLTLATPIARLALAKSADVATAVLGQTVTFDFAVTNLSPTGIPVGDIVVSDPHTTTPVFVAGHPSNPSNAGLVLTGTELDLIEPGATAYFRATHVVDAADMAAGTLRNTATVTGLANSVIALDATASNEVAIPLLTPPNAPSESRNASLGESVQFDPRSLGDAAPGSTAGTPSALAAAELRFDASSPGLPVGAIVSADGLELDVPGEGVWTITGGLVTFVPASGFGGDTTPVPYVLIDENTLSDTGLLSVSYPPVPPTPPVDGGDTEPAEPTEIASTGWNSSIAAVAAAIMALFGAGIVVARRLAARRHAEMRRT